MTPAERGVVTCIRTKDTGEAVALALSLRRHAPGVPCAVVVEGEGAMLARSRRRLESCWDHVIELGSRHARMGWQVKNVMETYSPFRRSLFLDADCLVVGELGSVFAAFEGRAVSFAAKQVPEQETGSALYASVSLPGLCSRFGLDWWPQIDGGGHCYWEQGETASRLFAAARAWADPARLASTGYRGPGAPDELTLQLAMAESGVATTLPVRGLPFVCWQPWKRTQVDVISGRAWNPGDPADREGLLRHVRVIHFGGSHHSRLYLRERRKLALAARFSGIGELVGGVVPSWVVAEDLGRRGARRLRSMIEGVRDERRRSPGSRPRS